MRMLLEPVGEYWRLSKDGDDTARALFDRHYSRIRYKDGRRPKLFVGPGEKGVLVTEQYDALFVWRKFIDDCLPRQDGVNCAIFRNEGAVLSSLLIEDAEAYAAVRWPGHRLYTYVNPTEVRSANPGYCFKKAGWTVCGRTSMRGLLILEKRPVG